jgi:sec-independent protein translocase protein TatC
MSRFRPSPNAQAQNPRPDDSGSPQDGHELRMSFFEHLGELRNRAFKAILALIIGTVIGFFVAAQGLMILQEPFCQLVTTPAECQFQTLAPTEGIIVYFRVALLVGGILSIPVITYQLLRFILPGLSSKEQRLLLLSLPAITVLFLGGVLFAFNILLPPALGFLQGFQPTLFKPEWTADLYLSFVTALIFWMGVAFETPLVFFVLSLLGFVTWRRLAASWRIAIIGAAVAAAVITPTIDPVNMFLVMGPLLGLYLVSILLVAIGQRIRI